MRVMRRELFIVILGLLAMMPAAAQETKETAQGTTKGTAQEKELLDYPLDTINGEEVYRYEVERSVGLYRVGVNFNVSQSEIVRLNPQLKERGLHFGEIIYLRYEGGVLGEEPVDSRREGEPLRIILGGGVMQQKFLLPKIREKTLELLNGYIAHPAVSEGLEHYIVTPGLDTRSGITGAWLLAREAESEL